MARTKYSSIINSRAQRRVSASRARMEPLYTRVDSLRVAAVNAFDRLDTARNVGASQSSILALRTRAHRLQDVMNRAGGRVTAAYQASVVQSGVVRRTIGDANAAVINRRVALIHNRNLATRTGLPRPLAAVAGAIIRNPGRAALLAAGVAGVGMLLRPTSARADTPANNQNGSSALSPGVGRALDGVDRVLTGALVNYVAGIAVRANPASQLSRFARFGGRASMVMGGVQILAGLTTSARADTPGGPLGTGSAAPSGRVDISGGATLAAIGAAGAGYAGYRMLTRGASAAPAAVPAIAAAPGRMARGLGFLRRAALPLTALAALNEASRGYTANGASGALRGAASSLTFGVSDLVAGAMPARPATASSSAHGAAVAGAQSSSVNATAAIAALANGSSVASPGVAVASDGQTAGYSRNRRLSSGITIHEQVGSYTTPVRR